MLKTITVNNPSPPATVISTIIGTDIKIEWSQPPRSSSQYPVKDFLLYNGSGVLQARTPALTYTIAGTPGLMSYYVVSSDMAGNTSTNSTATSQTASIGAITASAIVSNSNVIISWTAPTSTFPIANYEIRKNGANWSAATPVASSIIGNSLTMSNVAITAGDTYRIKATDAVGNVSLTDSTFTVVIANPSDVTLLSSSIIGDAVKLNWNVSNVNSTQYPIDQYEVYYPNTSTINNIIAKVSGTTFSIKVPKDPNPQLLLIGGTASQTYALSYYVKALDIMGNRSTGTSTTINITKPNGTTIATSVVDNNVLLYWQDATASLPITTYKIHETAPGATMTSAYAAAPNIGTKTGNFTTIFKTNAGTFTYWISGVDAAGNDGYWIGKTTDVSAPPNYILKASIDDSLISGTYTNIKYDQFALFGPIDTAELFGDHFTTSTHGGTVSLAWSTPQDQVTAGYPIYIQPAASSGNYLTQVYDYGTLLSSSKITVTPTYQAISGSPSIQTDIMTSPDGTTWSTYANSGSVFVNNFRYVQIRANYMINTRTDIIKLTALNIKLDQKLHDDAGTANVLATDMVISTASVTATVAAGAVTGFTGLVGGTGYSAYGIPSVVFSGGGGIGASAYVTVDTTTGAIATVNLLTGGTGYTASPTISFENRGTVVPWNSGVSFTDITAIQVTPNIISGTTSVIAVYDLVDIPNPKGFRVMALNSTTGARVAAPVSWSAKGY